MVTASQAFHDAVAQGKPQRALFLFDDYVFTNDDITGAVNFEEYFCGETDLTFGLTPSANINFTLLNDTGALNGFTGGEFRAWIGACISESTYKAKKENCRIVTAAGNVISGHDKTPYLRYNGDACDVQPSFPVKSLIWYNDTLYAIGKNGQLTAWAISDPDLPLTLPTWLEVKNRIPTWLLVKNEYKYGDEELVRSRPMLTPISVDDLPTGDFWTSKAKLWASRYIGIHLDTTAKKMTECRNGTKRDFEYVSLGVFIAERPARVKVRQIAVEGFDRMSIFDQELGPDFETTTSLTLAEQMSYLVNYVHNNFSDVVTWDQFVPKNGAMRPYSIPGTNGMTAKEYLSEIAEAAGAIARFDREGILRLEWLTNSGLTFDENKYTAFIPSEYTTSKVNQIQIRNSDDDIGTIVTLPDSDGSETYILQLNALLPGAVQDGEIPTGYAGNLLDRLAAIPEYAPSTASLFTDWALRAGDWITLKQHNQSFTVPVMRLTMKWTGSPKIDIEATGNEHRASVSAINRQEYRTGYAIHEVENNLESFRSYIQSPEGAASIIEQSATAVHISASQINLDGYATINDGFNIDTDGLLHSRGGDIGGFTITSTQIKSSGANPNIVLDSSNGTLTCKNGNIGGFIITASEIKSVVQNPQDTPSLILNSSGTLTCTSGQIGGFLIGANTITSVDEQKIVLNSNGTATIGALSIGTGTATFDGTVYVGNLHQKSNETMSGSWLTAGTVSGGQNGQLSSGVVTDIGKGVTAKNDVDDIKTTFITNSTTIKTVNLDVTNVLTLPYGGHQRQIVIGSDGVVYRQGYQPGA